MLQSSDTITRYAYQQDDEEVLFPSKDEIFGINQIGHVYDDKQLVSSEVIAHILGTIQQDETQRTSHHLYKAMPVETQIPSHGQADYQGSQEVDYYSDFEAGDNQDGYSPFDYHVDQRYARKPLVEKSILDDYIPDQYHEQYRHDIEKRHQFVHQDYAYDHFVKSNPHIEMHLNQQQNKED